jgi:hypothetical protein
MQGGRFGVDQSDDVESEIVHAGHAYWLARKGERVLPARGDFDPPIDIPRLIPNILIFDVLHEPLDFVYRLIGSKVRTHLARDLTGVRMSEVEFQRAGSVIWSHQAWVVEHAAPRFVRPPYVGPHKDFLFIEAVILPCGAESRVNKLMIFVDFVRALNRLRRV